MSGQDNGTSDDEPTSSVAEPPSYPSTARIPTVGVDQDLTPVGSGRSTNPYLWIAIGLAVLAIGVLTVALIAVATGGSNDPDVTASDSGTETTSVPASSVPTSAAPEPDPTPSSSALPAATVAPSSSTTTVPPAPPPSTAPPVVATPSPPVEAIPPLEPVVELRLPAAPVYAEWILLTDSSGRLTVQIHAEWTDLAEPSDEIGGTRFGLAASTDLNAFRTGWMVPGLELLHVAAVGDGLREYTDAELDSLLADYESEHGLSSRCAAGGIQPYNDKRFVGRFQLYERCATGTNAVVVAAVRQETAALILSVQMIEDRDLAALNRARATFAWTDLPGG